MKKQGDVKRILVLDDEQAVLLLLKSYLEGQGYEVQSAEDGSNVNQILEDFNPGLLITDIKMPGENGFSIAARVREQRPSIKIIYLSVWIDEQETDTMLREELLSNTHCKTLKKPFALDELLKTIQEF